MATRYHRPVRITRFTARQSLYYWRTYADIKRRYAAVNADNYYN